jgi:excisionase family DNA binding protein
VSDGFLTLHSAAERLGVHYMTAYRYVRLGVLPGEKDGGSWRVREADVTAFGAGTRFETETTNGKAPWSERLEARLLAGDGRGAWGVIEAAMAAGATTETVYLDIVAPALRRIGEKWSAGNLDIASEHRATGIAFRLIGRLGPRFARPGRTKGSVVIGTPPGERHSMPVAMMADLLRNEGYEVFDLGADIPVDAFVQAVVGTSDLLAVAVSVTSADCLDVAAELVSALHAAVPGLRVVVGGHAVPTAADAERLGALWAADAKGMAELLG